MHQRFLDYRATLNKTDQGRFDKVIAYYGDDIRPLKFKQVSDKIEQEKRSTSAKDRLHELNYSIQQMLFIDLGFPRYLGEFAVGQIVISDLHREPVRILELSSKPSGDFAYLDDGSQSRLNAVPINVLHAVRRKEEGEQSHFLAMARQKSWVDDLQKSDINSSIDFFLQYYANGEYDFNPSYQRDLEWSLEQKQAFILALLTGKTDLRPILLDIPIQARKGYHWEVLDGKQRLNAVIDFVENKYPVDGYYYKDLSAEDTRLFLNVPMVYTNVKYYGDKGWQEMTVEQRVELFLQVNDYGKRVSEDHLTKIKEKYL